MCNAVMIAKMMRTKRQQLVVCRQLGTDSTGGLRVQMGAFRSSASSP